MSDFASPLTWYSIGVDGKRKVSMMAMVQLAKSMHRELAKSMHGEIQYYSLLELVAAVSRWMFSNLDLLQEV